ncbi:hypothetical protein LUZ61_006000 [Rhynchospora tenuis]|uniref:Cell wall hydroxyproline-rich glycoprotein n=1 Tax=Rhynchospora tenuis TaxID=198213 RepID=A0AAD6EV90_9POAL|nr:hypothetical protein LUZ61_006000 [Rhynchospora tenuis]
MQMQIVAFFFLSLASLHNAIAFMGVGGGLGAWISGQNAPPSSASGSREFQALQAWKQAITEDPKGMLSNWVGPNVCTYKGVYCSDSPDQSTPSNVVAGIDLNKANLKGTLVKELSLLTHLTFFHINTNRFTGTVPDSFRDLQLLTELDLSNNQFTGPFPTATIFIPQLYFLDLRFNQFSGELPDEIFQKSLDAIFLNDNQFEGDIPPSLWTSPASVITLANNKLTGTIPTTFGYLSSRAKELLLLNNKLTGCIPETLGYLTGIEVLDLSFNSLTGHVPGSLSCLTGIEVLNVAHNQLTGELPDLLCELKRLANLSVSFNFFSGFSQQCNQLPYRNVGFDFIGNCIPGQDMQRSQPECNGVPGGDLSCLRIPGNRPVGCGTTHATLGIGIGVGIGSYELPPLGLGANLGPVP